MKDHRPTFLRQQLAEASTPEEIRACVRGDLLYVIEPPDEFFSPGTTVHLMSGAGCRCGSPRFLNATTLMGNATCGDCLRLLRADIARDVAHCRIWVNGELPKLYRRNVVTLEDVYVGLLARLNQLEMFDRVMVARVRPEDIEGEDQSEVNPDDEQSQSK